MKIVIVVASAITETMAMRAAVRSSGMFLLGFVESIIDAFSLTEKPAKNC